MTHAYTEALAIAQEAISEAIRQGAASPLEIEEAAREFAWQSCDGHEVAIINHKAIQFCADNDTSRGEEWLDDCGGISREGDCFGQIACRIAFATLLNIAEELIAEFCAEMEAAA